MGGPNFASSISKPPEHREYGKKINVTYCDNYGYFYPLKLKPNRRRPRNDGIGGPNVDMVRQPTTRQGIARYMENPVDVTFEKFIGFVTRIVDGRDPDLCGHLRRVGKLAGVLANRADYPAADVELITAGACLHDIGKLSISEYLLYKPARLTAAEFALVARHSEFGVDLLAPLDLDSRISDIVLYHHENYDGTGYPNGLAGDEIPPFARIVRICDCFDALTSNRPYQQGVSTTKALDMLRRDEHCFDPFLLDSFCRLMTEQTGHFEWQ